MLTSGNPRHTCDDKILRESSVKIGVLYGRLS